MPAVHRLVAERDALEVRRAVVGEALREAAGVAERLGERAAERRPLLGRVRVRRCGGRRVVDAGAEEQDAAPARDGRRHHGHGVDRTVEGAHAMEVRSRGGRGSGRWAPILKRLMMVLLLRVHSFYAAQPSMQE